MRGQPAYTVFDNLSIELEAEVQISGAWMNIDDAGLKNELSWSTGRIDLTSLSDVTRLRLSFLIKGNADKVLRAYGTGQVPSAFRFVVRNWNLSSRTRRLNETGKIELARKRGSTPAKIKCSLQRLELDLSEFSGEIELQPLVVATKEMIDHESSRGGHTVKIQKATIIGWTDPLHIILDRSRSGIDSLFKFEWESFRSGKVPGVGDDEFFAIRWDALPIIYLNKDVDGLEQVLTCADKTGKRARARDIINSVIAHQALSIAISTSIYNAREIRIRMPEIAPDDVSSELSSLERRVLEAWIHAADPQAGGSSKWTESLCRLVTMEESEVQRAISEHLPLALQKSFESKKATDELLKSFMVKGDS